MPAARATKSDLFFAKNAEATENTNETLPVDAEAEEALAASEVTATGAVTATRASRVTMFRPGGAFGWYPVTISTNAIRQCMAAGWRPECGDCGLDSCDGDPNRCTGKANVALRRCPVCKKKIYDLDTSRQRDGLADDPNEIRDEQYAESTPELRTKARLDEHLRYYHETEAGMYGVQRVKTETMRGV